MSYKKNITIKITIVNLFLLFVSCAKSQNMKNPDFICKDCGSFDLSKMSFNENISDLISKTDVTKTVIVNNNNQEKQIENLLKSDTIKLYKYRFLNKLDKVLGKKPFNYDNHFFFNRLVILTNEKGKIYAYEAFNFYDGEMSEIINFVNYLKKENKMFKVERDKLFGDLSVYQYKSDNKIVQVVHDDTEGAEERIINGKTSVTKSTYIKLNVYNQSFIKDSVEKLVKNDVNFLIFNEKHYQKF